NQESIRKFMSDNRLCAFVADGSILPRASDSDGPLPGALSFESPENMRVSVTTDFGETITGIGIKEGITVITGGGYSGKTTLLDAIESGIYNHIPGDGREYVLSDSSTLKTNAEDGRPVSNIDLSPFFKSLKSETGLEHFSTKHASGSVSQAANIIEAIGCGSKLLLIDEDKSATNFMIRDKLMRKIVPDEPIIPFTDRIEELRKDCRVSTILVIGGSSEYLAYADTVILMKEFRPLDITDSIGTWNLDKAAEVKKASWASARKIKPFKTSQPFLFFRSVVTENEKKIVLDNYSADITNLTALNTPDRLNTVMRIMESLLTDKEADSDELLPKITFYIDRAIGSDEESSEFVIKESSQKFYSQIRPIDAWCCINRMLGVEFL
ncbi:MAG: AAA family ATPase, partial [Lachnospiraceae bacterium]|nr:AAA family ATPase [Lachnospiraceae bacterium]